MSLVQLSSLARPLALVTLAALASGLAGCGSGDESAAASDGGGGKKSDVKLVFGFQTADYPALLKASGLFEDLPYTLETPVIPGPAAQISALYSKATDVGLVGENTAAFEAANSDADLASSDPKIYTVAAVSYPNTPYPAPTLFVRTSAGINSLAELRGHTVAYNFGGNIYAGYVRFLAAGGLTVKDIKPVQLTDNQAAAAAFVAGKADAVVSSYTHVAKLLDSGEARPLANNVDVGVVGGAGFISRPDVLADPDKLAAAKDFFARFSRYYSEWYPAHRDEVIGVYTSVLKQTPEIAAQTFETQRTGRLYKIGDPEFIKKQQAVVAAAYAAGGVKHDRDVSKVFNPVFDEITVPSS